MKVLLIGGGGREHAIAWKLSQSPLVTELLCAPGNAGIAKVARVFPNIRATDLDAILELAKAEKVQFAVVAPDDPLALGLVDRLEAAGIPAFGPTAAAARIEASKAYSKGLMKKYGIPTALYETFDDLDAAEEFIIRHGAPIVVKCDGLALGKGVVVARTTEEALNAVRSMMRDKSFGESGARVVIEEHLTGNEVTQLAFIDGEHYSLMPPSLDHKRAKDYDSGPNTGGMGAIAPMPTFRDDLRSQAIREIIEPTIKMLAKEGIPFKGVLYFGLMLTPKGPSVIEYNARFGDPETQAILPLLESDLMEIFVACRNGTLDKLTIHWSRMWCASVVLASGGYPFKYEVGYPIEGLEHAEEGGAIVFHAGTRQGTGPLDGAVLTNGGRVLNVSAVGPNLPAAVEQAYQAASCISFHNMHMRSDIGRPSRLPMREARGGDELDYLAARKRCLDYISKAASVALATSLEGRTTVRMMTGVVLDGAVWVQTDRRFLKCMQIAGNPRVAICCDDLQMEGVAHDMGHPNDNPAYLQAFADAYPHFAMSFLAKETQIAYKIVPTSGTLWCYEDRLPYMLVVDDAAQTAKRLNFPIEDSMEAARDGEPFR